MINAKKEVKVMNRNKEKKMMRKLVEEVGAFKRGAKYCANNTKGRC